jgi:hypothetical protein
MNLKPEIFIYSFISTIMLLMAILDSYSIYVYFKENNLLSLLGVAGVLVFTVGYLSYSLLKLRRCLREQKLSLHSDLKKEVKT